MNTDRTKKIQDSIIDSAITLTTSLSTSLGPRGSDKMIIKDGKTLITNDGATILKNLSYYHPINKVLSNLSKAQDENCGDGTTSVVILTGSILKRCHDLLLKGVHPTTIVKTLDKVKMISDDYIEKVKIHVGAKILNKERFLMNTSYGLGQQRDDKSIDFSSKGIFKPGDSSIDGINSNVIEDLIKYRDSLLKSVNTALNSKVVSSSSFEFTPVAVDAVLHVKGDLKNIRIIKKVGGAIEDLRLSRSVVLKNNIKNQTIKNVEENEPFEKNVKFAVLQFCVSPPKTNIDFKISINEHSLMERIIKEEREYILEICKKIKQSGAELILIQKSILRESCNELALHFLSRLNVFVVDDVEREEIDFILRKFEMCPSVDPDFIYLAECKLSEKNEHEAVITELSCDSGCSIVVRGSDSIIVDESERSLNDALCVVKCLFEEPYILPGGGAIEIGISNELTNESLRIKSESDIQSNDSFEENKTSNQNENDIQDSKNKKNNQNKDNDIELNNKKSNKNINENIDSKNKVNNQNKDENENCKADSKNKTNNKNDNKKVVNDFENKKNNQNKNDIKDSKIEINNQNKNNNTNTTKKIFENEDSDTNDEKEKINYSDSYIFYEISRAFEEIPYFLSRNAGLDPVDIINKLRNKIIDENYPYYGINVRKNDISCMIDENVVQPAKVTKSVIALAIETVSMILKIDDILPSKR